MHGTSQLLNWILWLPMLGLLGVLVTPKIKEDIIRTVSLVTAIIGFVLTLVLYCQFDASISEVQPNFLIKASWIKNFHIFYTLGIDGISLPMVLLTSLIFMICMLSSWSVTTHVKAYYSLLLLLQTTVLGVFLALDFFLFYVFWEVMLIPMFFLIGVWGGENREYAAIKFFLYTFFGSILMLVGMIALYFVTGQTESSFDLLALSGGKFSETTVQILGYTLSFAKLFFVFLFIGFAIKVPIFPFHTWLPHAHVQAPTAVSVILAGVLLKMGTYGFLRIAYPIFPEASIYFSHAIAWLGLINIIYGAFCAMAQTDVKKLIAYSSVSHMGFVMLGLAAMTTQGMNGAVLQMFNHGTSTAMLFLLVGILYERSHHRWIIRPDGTRGYAGLYTQLPKFSIVFVLAMFASMGLPGLAGFVPEALILLGSYEKFTPIVILSLIGLFFGAAYLLWMFKRMFFGEVLADSKNYTDMNKRELLYMAPLCLAVVVFGVWPSPLLNIMKASVGKLVVLLANY